MSNSYASCILQCNKCTPGGETIFMDDKSKGGNTNKDTQNKSYKPPRRQHVKKRYFLFWNTDTIVVNDKPIIVKFPQKISDPS